MLILFFQLFFFSFINEIMQLSFCPDYYLVLHFPLQRSQFVSSYKYSNGIFDDQKAAWSFRGAKFVKCANNFLKSDEMKIMTGTDERQNIRCLST